MVKMGTPQEDLITKKKRTRRPRPPSPLSLTMATTTSACSNAGSADFNNNLVMGVSPAAAGTSSGELLMMRASATPRDEEDMANCLILLAQGRNQKPSSASSSSSGQELVQAAHSVKKAAAATTASVLDVYQCKTCNRRFPSFQALGGHRASHKKPKPSPPPLVVDEHLSAKTTPEQESCLNIPIQSSDEAEATNLSLHIPYRAAGSISPSATNYSSGYKHKRVHECSICGAEFNSGQALGGHMRRHRPIPVVPSSAASSHSINNHQEDESPPPEAKKPRPLLTLDLNLPAPEEEHHHHHLESKFPFAAKEQVIVFSASPLVDCQY